MKKVLYVLASVLELLLLAGSWVINYFTRKKMGMARYVIYKNQLWENRYPMQILQVITVLVLIVLAIAVVLLFIRKKQRSVPESVMVFVTLIFTGIYAVFVLKNSVQILRAYYFISGLTALSVLIQIMKTLAGIMVSGHEK